ncbi:helix-turn-helix transcriptional regulator [Paenibacillus senegalensis]|uniref:helix-turn-helix transcriptional regulator n=1 Tax=Paenibacillus senegalensis TaxID=1465766 RepID=UPI000288460E|nr:helix-turn-helix domain-containing protein [Paenibacillus senegalensis]
MSYLILILIPVVVASMFVYFFVVGLIEKDAEKLNHVVMRNFSDQANTTFSSLETSMINMLSSSNVISFLKVINDTAENQQRSEWAHSLMNQLDKIQSSEYIDSAYLYFNHYDLVLDAHTYTNKHYYFHHYRPMDQQEQTELFKHFSGKKTMHFIYPHTAATTPDPQRMESQDGSGSSVSVLLSYPFNSQNPDVYLIVNLSQDKLRQQISINEEWVTATAIMNSEGQVIVRNGEISMESAELRDMFLEHEEGELYLGGKGKALSFRQTGFNNSWYYVSFVNLPVLLKPAQMLSWLSLAFLALFLVSGSLVSYYLSGKLYRPIQEIKSGLESHSQIHGGIVPAGNDFEVIKRASSRLITEYKELSQLVHEMSPIVQERLVSKILHGEYRDSLSIEYYAKEIDFSYQPKGLRTVLCLEIDFYSRLAEPLSETSKAFLILQLKEKIHQLAPTAAWLCQTKPNLLAFVVHHDAFLGFGPKEAAEMCKTIMQQPYYKASIGVGKTVQAIGDLHLSYDHALMMLEKYKTLNPEVDICDEDCTPEQESERNAWDGFLTSIEVNRITNLYKTKAYDQLLHALFAKLEEGYRHKASATQMKYVCTDVLNTWIRIVETEKNEFRVSFYSELLDKLERCVTWEELKQGFQEIHSELFQVSEPSDRSSQMQEILDYIHTHYGEELSIEQFAQQMNMSVGHFSRTFKEVVGEKYVEYIAKLRLQKAKQYLLETDLKIDEVAAKVGYWGRSSFIRIFRKYEGTTPAKYRTAHHK